jgi:hypothetical protein
MSCRAGTSSVPSTRAFKTFATSGWRLSRLENGLRIFEQDVDGEREEVTQDDPGTDEPDGDDNGTPTATNASDITSPGCKVRLVDFDLPPLRERDRSPSLTLQNCT